MIKLRTSHKHLWFCSRLIRPILIISAIIGAGCSRPEPTQSPELADRSFLTNQPCLRPCWYGLELNKSTASEAVAVLSKLPFVEPSSINKYDYGIGVYTQATHIDYDCAGIPGQMCGYLIISDGNLKMIIQEIQYDLSLKSAVDMLGEPAYIFHVPATPDGGGCLLELDWPNENIAIRSHTASFRPLCSDLDDGKGVDPNAKASEIYYIVDELFTIKPCNNSECPPWPGFQAR